MPQVLDILILAKQLVFHDPELGLLVHSETIGSRLVQLGPLGAISSKAAGLLQT
jgi:hypothetical protein